MNVIKKYSFLLSLIILCTLFFKLFSNYSSQFSRVEELYTEGSAVNLTRGVSAEAICDVLTLHNYTATKEDAMFVSNHIVAGVEESGAIGVLSDLNKRAWQVPARIIDSVGTAGFKAKLAEAQQSLGMDEAYRSLDASALDSSVTLDRNSAGRIVVKVLSKNAQASYLDKILRRDSEVCGGVVVRLSENFLDSLDENVPQRRTLCYIKTDGRGEAGFEGLDTKRSYSVLPIGEGYEYGSAKGTTGGTLEKSLDERELALSFTQEEHRVRLFDAVTLNQIKSDSSITIRSPREFKRILVQYLVLFFAAWVGLYVWCISKRKRVDIGLLSILMLLTGFCVLMMFSINNPLNDKVLGVDMAQGVVFGVVIMLLLLSVDFMKFYQNRLRVDFDIPIACVKWLFKPYRSKVSYLTATLSNKRNNWLKKCFALLVITISLPLLLLDLVRLTRLSATIDNSLDRIPKGVGYMLLALLLTVLLLSPLGASVGGMRVNLNLGILFQPSEIAKYLIIFFIAAFFCSNATRIVKYSQRGNLNLLGDKLKMLSIIIIGLGCLMVLYIGLGDMGPALVLSFTFIILYSIVKSQVDLEGQDETVKLKRVFSCDLAMLVYGVVSFILALYIGSSLGNMGIMSIAWFAIWIIFGVLKRQLFESAILFNIIISAFVFTGSMFGDSDISALRSVAGRLESRNEMCTNTWGTLPIDGAVANAGENTQVVEGLWGLASGGLWGQGLGNGSPNYIPAFHTDMILESIGEQMGFIGILLILLLLAILLRKIILLGYRTTHPFIFYLCLGISIVTAVQFIIISLGSTGIIPLTGVTVPLFSYGRVSMILNLAAFGVVFSVSSQRESVSSDVYNPKKSNIAKYNYPVSILSWVFSVLVLFILSVFFYHQFIAREAILVKPVYVNNAVGIPIIKYNPRIDQLVETMNVGDIYDRNGVLVATSDRSRLSQYDRVYSKYKMGGDTLKRQRRYYPFKEHLYFMLGDYNTKLFFSSSDRSPRGYMAEARHLAELRGYDNVLRDAQGVPVKVDLSSHEYCPGRFFSSEYYIAQRGVQLRDYTALIPYLKAGVNSDKLSRLNNREGGFLELDRIKPQDLRLTIDAPLQTVLQQRMDEYMQKNYSAKQWNKVRASVVVLDAQSGDLLASSNYPLPDYEQLREAPDSYSDNRKDSSWRAYTDMDLALTYSTPPGSTAKIMSAIAAFNKEGDVVAQQKYYVDSKEKIFRSEPTGDLDLKSALRYSSNCYFINLVNDKRLYGELADIYGNAGARIYSDTPYTLNYEEASDAWRSSVTSQEDSCAEAYERYKKSGVKEKMSNRTGKPIAWSWSWGQNDIYTTPAAMARVVSVVANSGKMPVTTYLLGSEPKYIDVASDSNIDYMVEYLKYTAKEHDKFSSKLIGGKTGTPERIWKDTKNKDQIINDGWYVCFIEEANVSSCLKDEKTYRKAPIAIAVRMERINDGMSGKAVNLTKQVVIDVLKEFGYVNL
ncbi:MAG: FtsW/RodA/SpoVE family cell cycle protein [Rikenellaceae bacterium]